MLVELKVGNFMSFKEETVFSMERSSVDKTTLPENFVAVGKTNILKSAVIFGPNASGKTNLVQALLFLKWLVKNSRSFERGQKIKYFPFKLDREYRENIPISFYIKFIMDNNYYEYSIHLKRMNENNSEYSFTIPFEKLVKNGDRIYERKTKNFTFSEKNKPSENIQNISKIILENTLLLSTYGSNEIPELKKPFKWFDDNLIVEYNDFFDKRLLIQYFFKNDTFKDDLISLMNSSDLGEIGNFEVIEKDVKMDFPENIPEILKDSILFNAKYIIKTYHSDNMKQMIEFDFDMEESKGTQKYLFLYGYIFDMIINDRTIVMDEIENSLHPILLKLLFQMVHKKGNKAQLISTSHSFSLLQFVNNEDEEIFRRDQIWFARKKKDKSTQLYSLINIGGIRKDLRIFKAYFDGRLEAFPDVRLMDHDQG